VNDNEPAGVTNDKKAADGGTEPLTKRGAPTGLQRLVYGPNELGNHCHLWKNAREGGNLVTQQAILMKILNI
jgi:hypothetical protein